MHFSTAFITTLALATCSVSGAALSKRKYCHTSHDSIGKTCAFANKETWIHASDQYCGLFSFGQKIPQGSSFPGKIAGIDDGFGKGTKQIFWGNYRIDKNGDHQARVVECQNYMLAIWNDCGGKGGWVNTDFGVVFGECIRA